MKTKEQAIAEKGAWDKPAWTVADEAIQRGYAYAEQHAKHHQDLARYKEAAVHAILKSAYEIGFLSGFAHKFDDHNYEEK